MALSCEPRTIGLLQPCPTTIRWECLKALYEVALLLRSRFANVDSTFSSLSPLSPLSSKSGLSTTMSCNLVSGWSRKYHHCCALSDRECGKFTTSYPAQSIH